MRGAGNCLDNVKYPGKMVLDFIHGKVTNKDLQAMFKISAQAVHKELAKLVELKVIKPQGQGRSLAYILA